MTGNLVRRAALALTGVLGVVVLVGALAGTTLALWRDAESFSGEVSTGTAGFAVERADVAETRTVATGPEDDLAITIGPAEAKALGRDGSVAVPVQVDALAQGHLGLRYEIRLPEFEDDSILGAADVVVFPVEESAACATESVPPSPSPLPPLMSTPVPAEYSDATLPTTEYWCLMAVLEEVPIVGTYTSTGTVSGRWVGGPVNDSDVWGAQIEANPSEEPDATLMFVHETFRAAGP